MRGMLQARGLTFSYHGSDAGNDDAKDSKDANNGDKLMASMAALQSKIDAYNAGNVKSGDNNLAKDTRKGDATASVVSTINEGVKSDDASDDDDIKAAPVATTSAKAALDMSLESSARLAATPLSLLPPLPLSFPQAIGAESAMWFNAFMGRLYRDASASYYFQQYFRHRAQASLNAGTRPSYIDVFRVTRVSFGETPPLLCNFKWLPQLDKQSTSHRKHKGSTGHNSSNNNSSNHTRRRSSASKAKNISADGIDEANPDSTVAVQADLTWR